MDLKGKYFKMEYFDGYVIVKGISDRVYPSYNATTPCKVLFKSPKNLMVFPLGEHQLFRVDRLIPMTEEEAMLEIL